MKIILGVTGGIAAYKSVIVARELKKLGHELQVVLTPEALSFVTPLTFSVLSGKPVLVDFFLEKTGEWNNHVSLAHWADLLIIAPATINTIAKLDAGLCDNLLLAITFSMKNKIILAPAMDAEMFDHFTYQRNIKSLISNDFIVLSPTEGSLASGEIGMGRMQEPQQILESILRIGQLNQNRFKGKKILVTAGPTVEMIDPVRFISNHSTGKMGYSLAESFLEEGGEVILVSGPVNLKLEHQNLKIIQVDSAIEMHNACKSVFNEVDIAIFTAAVADFRVENPHQQKIKKEVGTEKISIELIKNPDILGELGNQKHNQFVVGFALESEKGKENALKKLHSKNCDMMILNSLEDSNAGFGFDTNKITIFKPNGKEKSFPLKTKKEVSRLIIDEIVSQTMNNKNENN